MIVQLLVIAAAALTMSAPITGWISYRETYPGDYCSSLGLNLTRLPGDMRDRFEFIFSLSPRHDGIGACINMIVSETRHCYHIISWPSATCDMSNTTITCDCNANGEVIAVSVAGLIILASMAVIMAVLAIILLLRCTAMIKHGAEVTPV